MKIRLEKPAKNFSKLTGCKNEKPKQGSLHEKFRLDLYFVYRKHRIEIKVIEYDDKSFLIEILYTIYTMYSRDL